MASIINEVLTKIKYSTEGLGEIQKAAQSAGTLEANVNKTIVAIGKQERITASGTAALKRLFASNPDVLIGKLSRAENELESMKQTAVKLQLAMQQALAAGNIGQAREFGAALKVNGAAMRELAADAKQLRDIGVKLPTVQAAAAPAAKQKSSSGIKNAIVGGVVGGGVAGLALQGIAEVKQFLSSSQDAAREAETNFQVLKEAMQGNVQEAQRLADAAQVLQGKSIFNDDDVVNGNKLLVGLGLNVDKIVQYNETVAQSAVVTRNSFEQQSALIEGIARGQDRGIKSLKLTKEAQDELKKALKGISDPAIRAGKVMDALSKQFGDVDIAMSGTAEGAALRYANAMDSVKEKTGEVLNKLAEPVVNKIAEALADPSTLENIDAIGQEFSETFGVISEYTAEVYGYIKTLWQEVVKLVEQLGFTVDVSDLLGSALSVVGIGVKAVFNVLVLAIKGVRELVAVFAGVQNLFSKFGKSTLDLFTNIGQSIKEIFKAIFTFDGSALDAALGKLKSSFTNYGGEIKDAFVSGYNNNKNGIDVSRDDIQDAQSPVNAPAKKNNKASNNGIAEDETTPVSGNKSSTPKQSAERAAKVDYYKKELQALQDANAAEELALSKSYNERRKLAEGDKRAIELLDAEYDRKGLASKEKYLKKLLSLEQRFKKDTGSTDSAIASVELEAIKLGEKDNGDNSKLPALPVPKAQTIEPIEVTARVALELDEQSTKEQVNKVAQDLATAVNTYAPLVLQSVDIVSDLITAATEKQIQEVEKAAENMDARIAAQEERASKAKEFILDDGAENYKREKEALETLQRQEVEYASQKEALQAKLLKQQQDQSKIEAGIAFTVAIANAVAAVAKTAAQSGVAAPVTIALTLAAIASGIAFAKTLFLAEGGLVQLNGNKQGVDTVPARLTAGEFVVKKQAVDRFGVDKLMGINEGTYSPQAAAVRLITAAPAISEGTTSPAVINENLHNAIAAAVAKGINAIMETMPMVALGESAKRSGLIINAPKQSAKDLVRKQF